MYRLKSIRQAAVVMLVALLAGCGTSPATNFYTLSGSMSDGAAAEIADDRVMVGVGPVEVSPYLERSQLIIRSGANSVQMTEFDQWIEPIEYNIAKVVAANLSSRLPGIFPITSPWPEADVEYHVLMKVQQFHGDVDGTVTLHVHWGILLDSTDTMPVIRETLVRQPVTGTDYASIAGGMSAALGALSDQIAAALTEAIGG